VLSQVATTVQYSNAVPGDVSRDGKWLVYTSAAETGSFDIWKVDLQQPLKRVIFLETPAHEIHPTISPDGSFLAYASDETGRYEVYVQTFPTPGRRWQISSSGGTEPRWRGDGAELYHLSADRKIMVASMRSSLEFRMSSPVKSSPVELFSVRAPSTSVYRRSYDVTRDGKRFLVSTLEANAPPPGIHLLLNWTAFLER
jgi:Tol biopolymer transport system component